MNRIINEYISAKSDEEIGQLIVYGDITDSKYDDEDVSPKVVRDTLKEMGNIKKLELHINSYGGSVFAGNAIFNVIDAWKNKSRSKVIAYIDGIAASMGSGIAMAADEIQMPKNAMMMLHKPLSIVGGNADELRKAAEMLDKVEETLISNYMRHYNKSEDELRQVLSDETWFTAEEAKECGLCDVILEPVKMVAYAGNSAKINGTDFTSLPLDKIKDKFNFEEKEDEEVMHIENKIVDNVTETVEAQTENTAVAENVAEPIVENVASPVEMHREFMNENDVLNALGVDMSATDVLEYAKKGMNVDDKAQEKAKAYDKLFKGAVDSAIANGIKAKGEKFSEDRWRKVLNTLDYDEVIEFSNEWYEECKDVLKAGKRVSNPVQEAKIVENKINAEDYNF